MTKSSTTTTPPLTHHRPCIAAPSDFFPTSATGPGPMFRLMLFTLLLLFVFVLVLPPGVPVAAATAAAVTVTGVITGADAPPGLSVYEFSAVTAPPTVQQFCW